MAGESGSRTHLSTRVDKLVLKTSRASLSRAYLEIWILVGLTYQTI